MVIIKDRCQNVSVFQLSYEAIFSDIKVIYRKDETI